MSMRISERIAGAGLLCLALAACDGGGTTGDAAIKGGGPGVADCAIGANAGWSRSCAVERDGGILTIRHADGGFRRFHIMKDGRGLATVDGAEQAAVAVIGKGQIELTVGEDRYRLPATIASAVRP